MKKIFISIILSATISTQAFIGVETRASQGIMDFTQAKIAAFNALPDRNNYIWAGTSGYALSSGSFLLGKRYIPHLGNFRLGRINFPIKTLANLIVSDSIGYAPLTGYLYFKSKQQPPKPTT